MDALALPLITYYAAVLAVFCSYGLHRYGQVVAFLRAGGSRAMRPGQRPAPALPSITPRITVQLPMFNERLVVERIIEAACALDYPRDRLQIQVLDDSTDETCEVARRCCERLARAGQRIEHIHRTHRTGFKAGALAAGLRRADGELIAIFDADFVPPPDLLRRTVDSFDDPRVGLVQTRWTHLNRDDSWLTAVQALSLDGHFVIEQTARAAQGHWFNFNGTAGIWRRACIEEAGGWDHDTLTEDTDLSYRAQLAGWRFVYRPDVTCPAEVPPRIESFVSQQHRWNKGLAQNAIKLLPRILRSDASIGTRVEALMHLTSPLPYAALLLLTLLVPAAFIVGAAAPGPATRVAVALSLAAMALGTAAAAVYLLVGQWGRGRRGLRPLLLVPVVMALGVGVAVTNTRAIIEAIAGRGSAFIRTPKFNGRRHSTPDPGRRRSLIPAGLLELMLGALMLASIPLSWQQPYGLVSIPFLVLFAAGYLIVGSALARPSLSARGRMGMSRLRTALARS